MRDPADEEQEYMEQREAEQRRADELAVAQAKPEELVELKASFTQDKLLEMVAEQATDRLFGRYGNDSLEHQIKKHVHALVERAAKDIIDRCLEEHVAVATNKLLSEGFQPTDSYGSPKGERKTVISFVIEHLRGKSEDMGYNRKHQERWHAMADKLVEEYLQKEIAPELAKLKERAKKALDENVTAKIRDALMAGLGLAP